MKLPPDWVDEHFPERRLLENHIASRSRQMFGAANSKGVPMPLKPDEILQFIKKIVGRDVWKRSFNMDYRQFGKIIGISDSLILAFPTEYSRTMKGEGKRRDSQEAKRSEGARGSRKTFWLRR